MSKDFDGDKIKSCVSFECCSQLTVGELKKRLLLYPDDALIYIESSNSANRNDTSWSQIALEIYPCKQRYSDKKALMIVGSIK